MSGTLTSARCEALELALLRSQQAERMQRARADHFEESAKRAWAVAAGAGPRAPRIEPQFIGTANAVPRVADAEP